MKLNLMIFPKVVTIAIMIFASFAITHVRAQDCTAVTDAALIATIVDEIKADSLLAPQMSHIVVGSVNRFVKLQGWTDTKRGADRLMDIVLNTKCVAAVNVNRFEETPPPADSTLRPQPGGCGSGTKPCGDVCIPEADSCNISTKSGSD